MSGAEELLAESLRKAKKVASHHIIQSSQLTRIERERLINGGCLQKIVRGWYLLCPPHTNPGESTVWYASFWDFIRLYLNNRFKEKYCLSPEASMDLYLGKNYLPPQIVIMAKTGGTVSLKLPHNTSLLIYQENKIFPHHINQLQGINLLPFEYALAKMPPSFYIQQPQEAEIALRMLTTSEKILHFLLQDGMSQAAGRIIAALRHIKNDNLADTILNTMQAAGFKIVEKNPFKIKTFLQNSTIFKSPYSARIKALWEKTRYDIIKLFPEPLSNFVDIEHLINNIDSIYVQDAYHSLSIEGYQVTEALIEKVAKGNWHPDQSSEDHEQKNAMAAKGYYEAFKLVKHSIHKMSQSKKPKEIFQKDFSIWYLALFSPLVTAGIVPAAQLAGFRNQAVYIRNAMHVPPPHYAVRDCMEALFDCLKQETNIAVCAVLTHWLIGFIHPYNDGNGRMARFAMNAILVSQGYPWTIIHIENRKIYLDALEKASIHADIKDFAELIIHEMKQSKIKR